MMEYSNWGEAPNLHPEWGYSILSVYGLGINMSDKNIVRIIGCGMTIKNV
jgi:hypothetical protein